MLELGNMIIAVTSVSLEENKRFIQVFLDECLYKLKKLEYDRIDVSEGIDVNKTDGSRECIIWHYWYFF